MLFFANLLVLVFFVAGLGWTSIGFAPAASAVTIDDFEDMNLDGWLQSTNGGGGQFDVREHNGSNMARVYDIGTRDCQVSSCQQSLSRTFDYSPTDRVSFVMHAIANTAFGAVGGTQHAGGGVKVSFLNVFNVTLGSVGLYNVTHPSYLGPNDFAIPGTQESYDSSMAEFAALAGLGDADPIAKMNISFLAWGEYWFGGNIYPNIAASAEVFFDNFTIVPEPGTFALVCAGLGLMGLHARRRKGTGA